MQGPPLLPEFNTFLSLHKNDEDGDDVGHNVGDGVGADVGDYIGDYVGDDEFAGPPLPACIQYLSPTSASGPFAITAFHNRWPRFQISVQILIEF